MPENSPNESRNDKFDFINEKIKNKKNLLDYSNRFFIYSNVYKY